jgi:ribonuclease J
MLKFKKFKNDNNRKLKLVSLGGIGNVTKNMYVYEFGGQILIVDCGVGFPDFGMLGVDFVIPDISYLRNKKDKILGIVITHGHDDHIGGLLYILPELNVPVYATPLTCGLIRARIEEAYEKKGFRANLIPTPDSTKLNLGPFEIRFVHMTHSVPDTTNLIIKTPAGVIYHGSDFKFDWTPVDGRFSEVDKIARAGGEGVLLLLSDCLRAEKKGYTLSEKMIEETFDREISHSPKKFIVTTTSSNLSRIKQAIDVSQKFGRKVGIVGRSIRKVVEIGQQINYFSYPNDLFIELERISKADPQKLTLIVAGSQGQPGSSLSQIANRQHKFVSIEEGDTVVFSSDPIPGNVDTIHVLIDNLTRLGARVLYSDILDDLHVSGHAAKNELAMLIGLLHPKYVMPISGTFRQMKAYATLASEMGYPKDKILFADEGDVILVGDGKVFIEGKVEVKNVMVDGLGVGDIGSVVLRDRQVMADDGIVVVIVPVDEKTGQVAAKPDIVSRGFVYMGESKELISRAQKVVEDCLEGGKISDWHYLRRHIEDTLEKFLYNETKRRPMILPVVVEV